jgi:hypothetical protein
VTKSCNRLPLGRILTGVSEIDRVTSQNLDAAADSPKGRFVRQEQHKQILEIVRTRRREPQLLDERLQLLLSGLLAVKANQVIQWRTASL